MIDPVTAMAAVSSAVNLIKKASATIDDVRSLGPLLGKYYDAKHTATKAVREVKRKGGSNMGAAIELEMALKQQEDFEKQLQMLFMQTGNVDVWNKIQERARQMDAEDKAEAEREKIREIQRKRQRKELIEWSIALGLLIGVVAFAGYALIEFIGHCQKSGSCGF